MKKNKLCSLVLILVLVVGTMSPAFGISLDRTNQMPSKITYTEPDETVRIIVELEQAPILDLSIARGRRFFRNRLRVCRRRNKQTFSGSK